jgi:hypothetical protein
MSSPLQIAVLVLLGAALWSIFYMVNVLSQEEEEEVEEGEEPRRDRSSARRSLSKR